MAHTSERDNRIKLKELARKLLYYIPLSDRQFIHLIYRHTFKQPLHLDPPITFSEKIQWLKLFGSDAMYSALIDKYEVRGYVASKVGQKYLNDLYGVFNQESTIDFDLLPHSFVLKATHGSGWNIICRDKSQLDFDAARRKLRKWLKLNFYRVSREPNYKNIVPRIICERYLENEPGKTLLDYKFFCFHGHVQFIQVDFDRFENHTRNMFDRNWGFCPFTLIYPNNPIKLNKPENLELMIEVAETLAGDIPFVRVDLYNVRSSIMFGELSFTPDAGFGTFTPTEWDDKFGACLHLPG